MKKKRFIYLLVTVQFLAIFAAKAHAEITVSQSVEWLTVSSTVVATGRIIGFERVKGEYAVVYENYVLEVSENIKGAKGKKLINFTIRTFSSKPFFGSRVNLADEVIVFLSPNKEKEIFLKDKLVPTSSQYPLSVINLNRLDTDVKNRNFQPMDIDFNVLTDKKEIVEICRDAEKQLRIYLKTHRPEEVKGYFTNQPRGSTFVAVGIPQYMKVPNFMSPESKPTFF